MGPHMSQESPLHCFGMLAGPLFTALPREMGRKVWTHLPRDSEKTPVDREQAGS